ncbi:MAG: tetratricopeptide repeat protein, partial [Acidobacteria bacterium]|nr:tetratricopeptide repeat protein [Acidobacteriota bacterium]
SLRLAALYVRVGRTPDAMRVLEDHLRRFPADELASGLLAALRSGE